MTEKQRYLAKIAFDGENYHGWQIQKNASTVQQEINLAFSTVLQEEINVIGCGRTDTGVHASCFFLHFDSNEIKDLEHLKFRLNCLLNKHIAVFKIIKVNSNFNSRFDAISRTYNYHLHYYKSPFMEHSWYYTKDELDTERMNKASEILKGNADFSCFSKSKTQTFTNICTISQANWSSTENGLIFTISADRFLRNMVRAIVGTLVEIGSGIREPEWIKKVIESKDRKEAGVSVPGHALFLVDVIYAKEIMEQFR